MSLQDAPHELREIPLEQSAFKDDEVALVTLGNAMLARDSFEVFRKTIHPKMHWNWMTAAITFELQWFYESFAEGKRPKLAIEMPPQHGKSLAVEDFIAWVAGKRPDWKTIFTSYSDELVTQRNRNLYRLFQTERYQAIFPDFLVGVEGWASNTDLIEYVNEPGSFRNTTIGGQINGMELHLGVVDDYSKGRAEASSKKLRDKTWTWFTDDFMARFAQNSALLVVCTRWHIDDLLGRLEKKDKRLREVKFSAIAEKDERFRKKGDALLPAFKTKKFLLERKALMTEGSWQAEYQQHPYIIGGGIFPIEKMKVVNVFDPKDVANTVLAVDKAGTEGGEGTFISMVT